MLKRVGLIVVVASLFVVETQAGLIFNRARRSNGPRFAERVARPRPVSNGVARSNGAANSNGAVAPTLGSERSVPVNGPLILGRGAGFTFWR